MDFPNRQPRPSPTYPLRSPLRLRLSVERLAVQRRARRTSGSLMLLQFLCGDCVRCNGLFDGRTLNFRNFSEEADPISRQR